VSSPFVPLRAHGLSLCFGARKQEVGEAEELRGGAHGPPPRWSFLRRPAAARHIPKRARAVQIKINALD